MSGHTPGGTRDNQQGAAPVSDSYLLRSWAHVTTAELERLIIDAPKRKTPPRVLEVRQRVLRLRQSGVGE